MSEFSTVLTNKALHLGSKGAKFSPDFSCRGFTIYLYRYCRKEEQQIEEEKKMEGEGGSTHNCMTVAC